MADAITIKALQDASLDAKSLEEVVNGDEEKQVTTRLGETYPSVKKAINTMFENGGLPATPFATKALMTASALVDGKYAMVTDGGADNGLYVKTAGAWVKSAYDPVSVAHTTSEGQLYFDSIYFNDIRFEKSGSTIYVQANTYPSGLPISRDRGTEGVLYRRGYQPLNIAADVLLDALETSGKVLEPSPSGKLQNCFKLSSFELLIFSAKLKQFKIVMRDNLPQTTSGKDDWTILIGNNFGDIGIGPFGGVNLAKLVSNDLERVSEKVEDVSEKIDDRLRQPLRVWATNPYLEQEGDKGAFYLKFQDTTHTSAIYLYDYATGMRNQKYTLNDAVTAVSEYEAQYNADNEDESTWTRFLRTSPSGVPDCIYFPYVNGRVTGLYIDHLANKLVFCRRAEADKFRADNNYSLIPLIERDYDHWGNCHISDRIFAMERDIILERESRAGGDGLVVQNRLDDTVKAVAHRGLSTIAPENTLPAYTLAKQKGFSYVECDVLFTSDDIPVLLHDNTIDRTSTGSGAISSLTLAEVKEFDFGAWKGAKYAGTKIPTLREFLDLCRYISLHPYIELKAMTQQQAASVVQAVKEAKMQGKVTYISFTLASLAAIADEDPYARLGFVAYSVSTSTVDNTLTLKTETNEVFADVYGTGTTADVEIAAAYAASKGIDLEVWTINDGATALQLIEAGASGVTTDVLNIRELLNNKYLYTD